MGFNRIPELIDNIKALTDHHLEIGILGDDASAPHGDGETTIGEIAAVHEFGATIQRVGTKSQMTTLIMIPERSFMRAGWDNHEKEVTKKIGELVDGVLVGRWNGDAVYVSIGGFVTTRLQKFLNALSEPPLAQSTIDRKGSDNPLVDTGKLKDSITWKVV